MRKIMDYVGGCSERDWHSCFFYLPKWLRSQDGATTLRVWWESGERRLRSRREPPLEIHETWEVRFPPDNSVWEYSVVHEIEAFQ